MVNVEALRKILRGGSEKKADAAAKTLGGYSGQAAKAIAARKKAMAKALKDAD
jgi:hypothetical protein